MTLFTVETNANGLIGYTEGCGGVSVDLVEKKHCRDATTHLAMEFII